MIDVEQAVVKLVEKAKEAQKADDALKFSQAACNVANARATMMVKPFDRLAAKAEEKIG